MEKQMNNKILDSIDDIIDFIKESDTYKDYTFLKDKLSKNEKANFLIKEIKKNQQELVKKEINNEDIKELENKINNNLKELNKIPLYVEYINTQEKLNDLYQEIKSRLDDYFYEKLN